MSAPALKGNELSQEEELWLGAVLAACKAHNVTPKSKYEVPQILSPKPQVRNREHPTPPRASMRYRRPEV
ncbi:hypothetical protein T484DRAFT_3511147 [Baffinella frigidus]|nr:hypothetical protein T484DRAFT_3511147 [Cryptophyta sp. CCMP2293]